MLCVLFLDDGINPASVPDNISFESYTADENGVRLALPVNIMSHGTICYEIFRGYTNARYRLISMKVLDDATGTGNCKAVVKALEWCKTKHIDVINMSMGTRQYQDFAPIIEQINNLPKAPIIVAACSNQNELTVPACLQWVIGVRQCNNDDLHGKFIYLDNPYDQIEIYTAASSNSCAVPVISAAVCNYLSQGVRSLVEIKKRLMSDAVSDTSFATYHFYKNLLHTWEDIHVPVVLFVGKNTPEIYDKLKELIQTFVVDGYRAIGLTKYTETNTQDLIFNLNWNGAGEASFSQIIKLFYNFTLPDIMFLHMEINEALALPKEMKPEIIVSQSGELKLSDDAKVLYKKVTEKLCTY
jgi:hypothetical protein